MHKSAFLAFLLAGIMCFAAPASAATYTINGNGYVGTLEMTIVNGRVIGTIYGDPIEGVAVGRHVVFIRHGQNQVWHGWMWSGVHGPHVDTFGEVQGTAMLAGTFSEGGENQFPWFGIITPAVPTASPQGLQLAPGAIMAGAP